MVAASDIASRIGIALLHYPVYDRNRLVVATAVTNLDLHDIARAARTFGLSRYYVVTPVSGQQMLAERICRHWLEGFGAVYNPDRRNALELVKVVDTLDDALADMTERSGRPPKVVVTGAANRPGAISSTRLAEKIRAGSDSYLLLFGTGWGLTEEVFARADLVLEPISGGGDYNHLSVRSAAAIVLDRLLGRMGEEKEITSLG